MVGGAHDSPNSMEDRSNTVALVALPLPFSLSRRRAEQRGTAGRRKCVQTEFRTPAHPPPLSSPEDGITAGAVEFNQPYGRSRSCGFFFFSSDLFAETETQIKKAISFTTFQCCHSLLNRESSVMTDFVCLGSTCLGGRGG